ncbi:MAG: transposase [Candidatus Nitrosopolaris sp.]
MASYGWCYYKGTSWGKNVQVQIQHRAKFGNKRSMVVDDKGVPLGITVDAASRHDTKMTRATLQSIVVRRPEPTTRAKQHMCMDKGYDYLEVHELLEDYAYTIHIRLRGEHRVNCKRMPRYRARQDCRKNSLLNE